MRTQNIRPLAIGLFLMASLPLIAIAQQQKKERKHEFYFSWGYNAEWYTHSNIHISQPSLGNDYTFEGVHGHDHLGWDEGIFHLALTIPQYNYRIGYILNKKRNIGIEINFDHTKYIFADNQIVQINGTMNGKPFNGTALFKQNNTPGADSNSYYYLNNGANFLLINLVKRWHLMANKKGSLRVDGLVKGGIGPVIPHVQDKFFDQPPNDQHFQVGGMNIGFEGALRATFFNTVFLEYTNKLDYARYWGLRIYQGTAAQAFGTYEMILNLGLTFPVGKRG